MPHTLLLADDNVITRRLLTLTFAGEGIEVVAVDDKDQAIAAMAAHAPDIVLADLGADGRSGYELARHMQQTAALAQIPILLLAGAFEPVEHATAVAAGCAGVLGKPLDLQRLGGRVKELLAQSAPVAENAPPTPSAGEFDRIWQKPFPGDLPSSPPARDPSDVEGYFERLDEAFAALTASSAARPSPRPPDWDNASKSIRRPESPDDLSEEIVEQVTQRVLERLTDRVLREVIEQMVSERADRLIREEIDRIKRNIK